MKNGNIPFEELNLSIRTEKQREHIFNTAEWRKASEFNVSVNKNPKSYFYSNIDVESIVRNSFDKKDLIYTSQSQYPRSFFTCEKYIGAVFDRKVGDWVKTKRVMVIHSKKGWHAVPVLGKE